ncbi:MAG: hypothetical protein JWN69_1530 [Alphaproteobacteria bacterium]|nr:hypothetical protein [Alphaproteobacteria bacterium]
MRFSYNAVWQDTVALMRGHLPLVIAIAGVFLFLPDLLVAHFLPPPEKAGSVDAMITAMSDYLSGNWHWLLIDSLVNMLGTIAILSLIFDRERPTVGGAIAGGIQLLPSYFVAFLLSGLILGTAFMALIVPFLYFYGRLVPLAPVVVAERRRNPIDALRRCFEVTRGNGWALFGLILIVFVAFTVVTLALAVVFGSLFVLLLGRDLGGFLLLILTTALSAAFHTVLILLGAAAYRQLSGAVTEPIL